jgi:osmotically-inducible protein OsmY
MHMAKAHLLVVAFFATALFAAVARADQDADVASRVRQALIAAHIPNAANIQVQSFNGEVDLAGVVFTERSKARVASIAIVVPGVTSVQNGLEVQPRADNDDDATTARVQAALAAAQLADVGPIEVSTFNGEVDLGGVVYSSTALTQVMDIAGRTRGATSISSEIEVRDRP